MALRQKNQMGLVLQYQIKKGNTIINLFFFILKITVWSFKGFLKIFYLYLALL